ncbi:hypothetical protein JD844_032725 [Phrynosoma platyrhinos]|uniref:Uncharacterized protein n=1 Tax=Phrynosoma platyrhinos TaxID=52577 RepID=A0ABQ7T5K2_PHRPL|nr:hypothetical protein JD844_032725 [Phrynosoma platyrhinos]
MPRPHSLLMVLLAALGAGATSAGLICLKQPHNVTVHIVDANISLKWEWDNPCNLNVTFSVRYQGPRDPEDEEISPEKWSVILKCQNITIMECDLSSTTLEYFDAYIVNVRADTTKDHSPWANLTFCPYEEAKIGPPGVWLESINGNEKINILHPEAKQLRKMWESDNLSYTLTIWKNSSHPKKKTEPVFPGQFIHGLEPETTYCLKVNAYLISNIGLYSSVYCKRTPKAWIGLPVPENLRVHALNMKCVLYWDTLHEGNVSFLVQYLL